MPSIQNSQLKAMLTLLSDSDQRTVDIVKKSLTQMGQDIMPSLLRARKMADPTVQEHLQSILEDIEFNHLEMSFTEWASSSKENPDLETGAFLLAKFCYPDLDPEPYRQRLDRMAQVLTERLNSKDHPPVMIQKINQLLFKEEALRGDAQHYYDPDNSCLNRVLDRNTGIPISLSIVYLLVTQRLGLPIVGIGLPGHFILKYETPTFSAYIDAFNQGQLISREECIRFLINAGYGVQETYFSPATHREIIQRMMRNLVFIYNQMKDSRRADRLKRLVQLVSAPPNRT